MAEPDVQSLLSVAEAIRIIDQIPVAPRTQRVNLSHAQGNWLAKDLCADRDFPPFDKSQMDGFALRSADVTSVPCELKVVGEVAAGAASSRALGAGEAMAIMTGAPLPDGADAVIPVEFTNRVDSRRVRLLEPVHPGRFIARQGADCVRGQTVLPAGTRLGAAQIAVAAAVGAGAVDIFLPPSIGILATGDEIVPADVIPGDAQIRNSNNPMLVALLWSLGFDAHDLGIVRDDESLIRSAIERCARDHDVLLVSGGMSMGEYDYVRKVLCDLGYDLKITKLRIKPGKPFVFAVSGNKMDESSSFVFGLPGNPLSGFCCALRLVSRLLVRMSGGKTEECLLSVKLGKDLPANGPREFYQPGVLCDDVVMPLAWKGSADLFTLARANVLLVRPENDPARCAGDVVSVLEIPR